MKYKSLINPLYLWMPDENQISKYGNCRFSWGKTRYKNMAIVGFLGEKPDIKIWQL
jgi:hypothetical protein